MDEETRDYYEREAEAFSVRTLDLDMSGPRSRFLRYLAPGSRILDAGCGSGRDLKAFRRAGYAAEGADGSARMCEVARRNSGAEVMLTDLAQIGGPPRFGGIWANASLLHIPAGELPAVLRGFHAALLPGGIVYASFKQGSGEERREGRLFADYTLDSAGALFTADGLFSLEELFETPDVRDGQVRPPWVNVIARAR